MNKRNIDTKFKLIVFTIEKCWLLKKIEKNKNKIINITKLVQK